MAVGCAARSGQSKKFAWRIARLNQRQQQRQLRHEQRTRKSGMGQGNNNMATLDDLRPPIAPAKRTVQMMIRLTPQEHRAIVAIAKHMGVKPSTWAHHYLLEIIEMYKQKATQGKK
jgi:hypothetical protein